MRDIFLSNLSPWVFRSTIYDSQNLDLTNYLHAKGVNAYTVDGKIVKCRNEMYDCFDVTFSFPKGSGKNLNALFDLMTDGDIMKKGPCAIILSNAEFFLSAEPDQAIQGVLDTLGRVGAKWSEGLGWPWRWPPTPFHAAVATGRSSRSPIDSLPMVSLH